MFSNTVADKLCGLVRKIQLVVKRKHGHLSLESGKE